jgi:subtilisin family serine protease
MSQTPRILNYASRGAVQSGSSFWEPYSEAGLTGKGQIVAVMDTGLDDLSCFFSEESCSSDDTSKCLTPRNASVDASRRKVIQYTAYDDGADYTGGHGTHVAGTIVGNPVQIGSASDLLSARGVAFDAKVVMQDVGDEGGNLPVLSYLSLEDVAFPAAYEAGARVHTNSWGGDSSYSVMSAEVDRYVTENDEMLILFAAGNSGNEYGFPYVGEPGTAKNALTVGSGQLRDNYNDLPFSEKTVSSFSSIGPVQFGQIKPDIIAPGSNIISTHAEGYDSYNAAIAGGDITQTCSAHELSGTSMATPLTAGVALLVRQYFEDGDFWAANCVKTYSYCKAFAPKGYLVKAAILHAGEPMDRFGSPNDQLPVPLSESKTPDVYQGYGMINLATVLPLPSLNQPFKLYAQDNLNLTEGRVYHWDVTVSDVDSTVPLKVTLVWYDPLDPTMTGALVHDLDLAIRDPENKMHWGNGVEYGDTTNPNEQVTIASPRCVNGNCVYTVIVRAYSVADSEVQPFGIVMTTAGGVSGGVESDDSMFDFNLDPFFENAMTVTSTDTEEKIRVELGSINGGSTFSSSFDIDSSNPLSNIFIEFSEWENASYYCPASLVVTITDPFERDYTISSWPLPHALCLYDEVPKYVTTYFPHSVGVDLLDLGGNGTWSIQIDNVKVSAKAALVLTFAKQKPSFTPFEVDVSLQKNQTEYYVMISDLPECQSLAYVEMKYFNGAENCAPLYDTFDLIDPTGRRTAIHQLYDFDWFASNTELHSSDLVSAARLGGNGVYTLVIDTNCSGFVEGYINLTLHFALNSTCPDVLIDGATYLTCALNTTLSSCLVEHPEYVGDGKCNAEGGYNVASCGYDGGDCCENTCEPGDHQCGSNGYDCKDPESSGNNPPDSDSVIHIPASPGYKLIREFEQYGKCYIGIDYALIWA